MDTEVSDEVILQSSKVVVVAVMRIADGVALKVVELFVVVQVVLAVVVVIVVVLTVVMMVVICLGRTKQ